MIVNGESYEFESMTVSELLEKLEVNQGEVVVEVNRQIIMKTQFAEHMVDKSAQVELVAFVGGG